MCVINAQSVCNKTDLLTDHFIENKFDIIAITETWLSYSDAHKRVIGNLSLPGYNFLHVPRENRPGGGLAVILKIISRRCKVLHTNVPVLRVCAAIFN